VKGNMDIELAVDAMEISAHVDEMVLFSGDGDFRSLVEAIQRHGVRVTVVSTISTQPAMIAGELRRQADVFLDLRELQPRIARDPVERPLATADSAPKPMMWGEADIAEEAQPARLATHTRRLRTGNRRLKL
jgi:uncharacterized LabA/DUF88 family protein